MGNFLADVGRANVLGTATQTISAIDSMQRNRALNEESAMRLQKEQYALNQQKKEDAWLDERIPLRSQPMFLQLPDKHKKKVEDYFAGQGTMDPETGMGTRRDFMTGVKFMEETREGMENFIKPLLDEQLGELNQLQVQIKEAEAKGDTKKIQTLQPMLEAKTKQYGMGSKVYGDRLEQIREIEKIEAKKKAELATQKITYKTLGANIYKIENGKSTLIQKGSTEERAVTNAMHDPSWRFADEVEQIELIEKHKRFLGKRVAPKKATQKTKDYGPSNQPEDTTAKKGKIRIITKNGRWIEIK